MNTFPHTNQPKQSGNLMDGIKKDGASMRVAARRGDKSGQEGGRFYCVFVCFCIESFDTFSCKRFQNRKKNLKIEKKLGPKVLQTEG